LSKGNKGKASEKLGVKRFGGVKKNPAAGRKKVSVRRVRSRASGGENGGGVRGQSKKEKYGQNRNQYVKKCFITTEKRKKTTQEERPGVCFASTSKVELHNIRIGLNKKKSKGGPEEKRRPQPVQKRQRMGKSGMGGLKGRGREDK